jgi:hypothetical protein
VKTTAGCEPAAPPLLVRRAVLAGERDVAALLRDVPVGPVEVAVGEVLRHPGAERVPVGAFEPEDVAALVERLTGENPDREVVSVLMSRTGGNPFYATELVRLISSEHRRQPLTAADVRAHDVPTGIREVLMRRVGRLPDDTQSLLMVAAVAGRELQPDLLEHVNGIDAEHLLLGLEPAIGGPGHRGRGQLGFPVPASAHPREPVRQYRPPAASTSSPPSRLS